MTSEMGRSPFYQPLPPSKSGKQTLTLHDVLRNSQIENSAVSNFRLRQNFTKHLPMTKLNQTKGVVEGKDDNTDITYSHN